MSSTLSLPYSEACERNKTPINEVLTKYLVDINALLEIGSGTGQHADFFTELYPSLSWQMTDCEAYLEGLSLRQTLAKRPNFPSPNLLDVNRAEWGPTPAKLSRNIHCQYAAYYVRRNRGELF